MTDARLDLDDPLAALAPPGVQTEAADLARDAFTRAFRHAAAESSPFPLDALRARCQDWVPGIATASMPSCFITRASNSPSQIATTGAFVPATLYRWTPPPLGVWYLMCESARRCR